MWAVRLKEVHVIICVSKWLLFHTASRMLRDFFRRKFDVVIFTANASGTRDDSRNDLGKKLSFVLSGDDWKGTAVFHRSGKKYMCSQKTSAAKNWWCTPKSTLRLLRSSWLSEKHKSFLLGYDRQMTEDLISTFKTLKAPSMSRIFQCAPNCEKRETINPQKRKRLKKK